MNSMARYGLPTWLISQPPISLYNPFALLFDIIGVDILNKNFPLIPSHHSMSCFFLFLS